MSVSPARAAGFDALRRVEQDAAFATDALDARLSRMPAATNSADAALATELVMGVLRWRRLLDFLVERYASRAVESLDLEVLLALRLGLYQLRFLSRVPASAAVNESVELVKQARKRSAAGLVNAALRRASCDAAIKGPLDALLPADAPPSERLSVLYSHPAWLVGRWLARYGEPATRALLEADNRPPRLCAASLAPGAASDAIASLAADGFDAAPSPWLSAAIELRSVPRGGVGASEAFRDGRILIQDDASQMVPLLLDVRSGQRVLDVCAAPGGKTARLAAQAAQGQVIAGDVHPHRLRQMRDLLSKVRAGNVHAVALDATAPLPFVARFERVLLDAPCSGTGTLARNPEIRWRLAPGDLPALAEKQKSILRQALAALAPGGRLVYSTCSLEPEENEQVIASAVAATPGARVVSSEPALVPHLRAGADSHAMFDANGFFRTLPSVHGTDGFFAAAIELPPA
jgi:16S rRNA (cytosine967-C5)-methyltransferase